MSAAVHIEDRSLVIDGEPLPLVGGEIHYWRHDPAMWPGLLDRACEMELSFVSTYVPWEFHEVAGGGFDFGRGADPRRDLGSFLTQAHERGLKVFARPGPYVYAEMEHLGVPERVAKLPKNDPVFRGEAETWLRAAARELLPHLATQGGPIVLVQADNECDPFPHLHGRALGLEDEPGQFQAWLAGRYRTFDRLNARWSTSLGSFAEARGVQRPQLTGENRSAWLDTQDFLLHLAEEHAGWALDILRDCGIDVPLVLNTWPHHNAQDWWRFSRSADLLGIDPYPANLYRGHPGEQRAHRERFRYLRSLGGPTFITEFGAGIWRGGEKDTGSFDPEHYRLAACTALAEGVTGWSWYMLAEREEWLEAPIDHEGRPRPAASVLTGMAHLLRALEPHARRVVTTFAATWSPRHHQEPADPKLPLDDPVLEALHDLGCAFDFLDVDRDRQSSPPILFYTGPAWLSRAGQEGLLAYLDRGGTLVFHDNLPVRDEDGRPLDLLDLTDLRPGADPEPSPRAMRGAARGPGRVIVVRAPTPTRANLLALLAELRALPALCPETPGIQAALLTGEGRPPALVVVNPGDAHEEARLHITTPALRDGRYVARDLESGTREIIDIENRCSPLSVPPRGGRAVSLEPLR